MDVRRTRSLGSVQSEIMLAASPQLLFFTVFTPATGLMVIPKTPFPGYN